MKISLVQIQSTENLDGNLKKMKSFVERSKEQGASLVVFPEMAYFTAKREGINQIIPRYSELIQLFQSWAKEFKIGLVPGTLREPVVGDPKRYFNTLLLIGSDGQIKAKYQKIFRFKANLPHHSYDEGRFCEAGHQVIICEYEGWTFGFAICYDLRFPELFRSLRKKGARVFILPSAFTVPTGEAHWEVLLRTRAIENQAYVIAPDQTLNSGEGLTQFGHSVAIDPWGQILSCHKTEEGMSVIELSRERINLVESQIALWESRNEVLFPIA
ncbi:MAG: hypothetical protein EBQ92_04310 [Proteobacteria bacterium]|nr:hypothetical protein [Pseudomonadota bacterium]